jgi:hypothetical protein
MTCSKRTARLEGNGSEGTMNTDDHPLAENPIPAPIQKKYGSVQESE